MGKIKYKIKNHKKRPLCDYKGNCKNFAFKEVYPNMGKENEEHYWCYLCKKHFIQEKKRFKGKLVYCSIN
jgi:hypothetical protein